jgi:hypothetical protein
MHGQNGNKEKNCRSVQKMHIGTCHNINPNFKNACQKIRLTKNNAADE